jgi:hypothetical protein
MTRYTDTILYNPKARKWAIGYIDRYKAEFNKKQLELLNEHGYHEVGMVECERRAILHEGICNKIAKDLIAVSEKKVDE